MKRFNLIECIKHKKIKNDQICLDFKAVFEQVPALQKLGHALHLTRKRKENKGKKSFNHDRTHSKDRTAKTKKGCRTVSSTLTFVSSKEMAAAIFPPYDSEKM